MDSPTLLAMRGRVEELEAEIAAMRQQIERESLSASESQYLARCFDLLGMELLAVRQFLARVTNTPGNAAPR